MSTRQLYGLVLVALVMVAILVFLYIGTTHRDRCIKDGNVGCTILPWSGQASGGGQGWGGSGVVVPGSSP